MTGYRRELDQVLEAIEARVIELFAMIEEDLPRATAALLDGDVAVPPALADHQRLTDALYPQLEAMASRAILARHRSPAICGSCCRSCGWHPSSSGRTARWCRSPPGPIPG
jgi:hypothetical protein